VLDDLVASSQVELLQVIRDAPYTTTAMATTGSCANQLEPLRN
jgi:hypothetical protein